MSSKDIYSGPRVKDLETFIQKAQFVHDSKYSYEKTEYVNTHTKVIINCKKHGDFEQTPNDHLKGHGCALCYFDSYRSNTQSFIQKAQFVHGDKYSYDKSEYVNSHTKITINCPIHGEFEQTPANHVSGHGCLPCHHDSHRSNTDNFIEQAKSVHGEKYSYERSVYAGAHSKITINCKKHGDFEQTPNAHLRGSGCPDCRNETHQGGYSTNKEEYKDKNAIFYHVRFTDKETDEAFEKFGITKNSVKDRFRQITNNHNLELEVINEYHTTLYEAIEIEAEIKQHLINNNLAYRVHTLKDYPVIGGWTECFRCGALDSIL